MPTDRDLIDVLLEQGKITEADITQAMTSTRPMRNLIDVYHTAICNKHHSAECNYYEEGDDFGQPTHEEWAAIVGGILQRLDYDCPERMLQDMEIALRTVRVMNAAQRWVMLQVLAALPLREKSPATDESTQGELGSSLEPEPG